MESKKVYWTLEKFLLGALILLSIVTITVLIGLYIQERDRDQAVIVKATETPRSLPPIWTSTPYPNSKPYNQPTPSPTAKVYSYLFTGDAKDYLPQPNDFPKNFEKLTSASGSFDVDNSRSLLSSYSYAYRNPDLFDSFYSPAGILTNVAIFDSVLEAKRHFDHNSNLLDRKDKPPLDLIKHYDDMPHVDDAILLLGVSEEDGLIIIEVRLLFYRKNISSMVIISGATLPNEFEDTVLARVEDAKYYADIIASNLK